MTDPSYNPAYSQFCYEIPFMPGQTQYMDTPVVPTACVRGRLQPAGLLRIRTRRPQCACRR